MDEQSLKMVADIRAKWIPNGAPVVVIYHSCNAYFIFVDNMQIYTKKYIIVIGKNRFSCYHRDGIVRLSNVPDYLNIKQCEWKISRLYNNFEDAQLYIDSEWCHEKLFSLLD